jgi:hypothetical protein
MSSLQNVAAAVPSKLAQVKNWIQPVVDVAKKVAVYVGSVLLEIGSYLAAALKNGISAAYQFSKNFVIAYPQQTMIAGGGIVAGMVLYSIFSHLFSHRPAVSVSP